MPFINKRLSQGALAAAVFLLLFYLLFFFCRIGQISVQIEISADKSDILTFYWPDDSGRYYETATSEYKYPEGSSSFTLHLETYPQGERLRMDPGKAANTIQIKSLSITRLGKTEVIPPAIFRQHIQSLKEVEILSESTDGLKLKFSSKDPQIYLDNLPLPSIGLGKILSVIISLLILVRFTSTCADLIRKPNLVHPLFLSFTLYICGWLFHWPFYAMEMVCLVLAVALVNTLSMRLEKRRYSYAEALSYSVVTVIFITCLFIPFTLAVQPPSSFLQRVSELYDEAVVSFRNDGLQEGVKQLTKDIDGNFTYHYPFREDFVNLNAKIKIFGMGFSPTTKAIAGKDGFFFEGYGQRRVEGDAVASFDNITDYMGLIPLTEQQLEDWRITLEERYYWLKELGSDYIFTVAPSKALIFPEKLPQRIYDVKTELNKQTRYDQLLQYLKENSIVPVADLRQPLLDAKQRLLDEGKDLPLYYRTDFHWTYLGAFFAYQALVDAVNTKYPELDLNVSELNEFNIHERKDWVHFAFIYSLGLKPAEHQNETYLTLFPEAGSTDTRYSGFQTDGINDHSIPDQVKEEIDGTTFSIRTFKKPEGKLDRLFVIGDSFAEKYFAYFTAHAKESYNFRTLFKFEPPIYKKYKPDLVVQEMLNMYLLNDPPRNPPEVKEARVRALKKAESSQ